MDRILRDTQATLTITLRDSQGTPVDATGSVTAAITNSGGTAITGSPFTATKTGTGVYEVTLAPDKTTTLDVYDVVWTGTVSGAVQKPRSQFEIIGRFMFAISELRAFDTELNDATKYPANDIEAVREAVEERIESFVGFALRPRGARAYLDGSASAEALLPDREVRKVVSVKMDGVAFTQAELDDLVLYPNGILIRKELGAFERGKRNVEILYEHGLVETPEPVRRAAMALAREHLVGKAIFDRATGESTELGVIRFTLAGRDGPTGIPEVDAVLSQYARPKVAIG